MSEPEILLPVKCPICLQQSLTAYRIAVVVDALATGDIRLYAGCHIASWDASEADMKAIRDFLVVKRGEHRRETLHEFSIDELQNESVEFIFFGDLESDDQPSDLEVA
jgi:hypothetical protein